jgi:hypothetical protein
MFSSLKSSRIAPMIPSQIELDDVVAVPALECLFDVADQCEGERDEKTADDGKEQIAGSDRETESGQDPDRRRGGETGDMKPGAYDRPCPEEADSRYDLRRDASRIGRAATHAGHFDRYDHDEAGAETHEHVRPYPGRLTLELAFEPDRSADREGDEQPHDICAERFGQHQFSSSGGRQA